MAQTVPGTTIRNVFTGTYDGAPAPVQSNDVNFTIAEVAGITVISQTPRILGPDLRLDPNDQAEVDFVICNVGNDPSQVFIPDAARLSGANVGSFTAGTPQLVAFNGTILATPIALAAGGETTGAIAARSGGALTNNGSLPAVIPGAPTTCAADQPNTLVVRVPLTVSNLAQQGDSVRISLGNTATADAQNVAYTPNPGSVYTVDNGGAANGDTAGAPLNGEREAMDGQDLGVGATFQAFARVLLAQTYSNGTTPGDIRDDRIDYCLATRIEDQLPSGLPTGQTVLLSDLYPTVLTIDGTTLNRILISNVIPPDTQLAPNAPVVPGDGSWSVLYTTDAVGTRADKASWATTAPSDLATVTRIGFANSAKFNQGTTTESCLTYSVQPRSTFTGGRIEAIAQLFGQSQPGPVVAGTPTQLVYDESGDQTFNNGLLRTNPDPLTTGGVTGDNGGITDGVANIGRDGFDPGPGRDARNADTNQGNDGPTNPSGGTKTIGGETLTLNMVPSPVNGPKDKPGAVGPQTDNDDFTNKVLIPPASLPPDQALTDAQTQPIPFTNTVNNPTNTSQIISLLPTPPNQPAALPDGTKVTLTDPATGNTATYTYMAATGFTFVSGTGTTASQPLQITVPSGAQASYQVTVDLPSAQQLREYPVPITAFVDQGTPGLDRDDPANITIDRIYTGFIKVTKEARILEADGTTEVVPFTTDQTLLGPASEGDRIIEYRVTYTNLSQTGGGDNVTLPATDFVLTEDGTTGGNNWFELTNDPLFPGTAPTGSATATLGSLSITPEGSPADIKIYAVTIPSLTPGETGVLTFRRRIVEQ